jgi:hypothetical protein
MQLLAERRIASATIFGCPAQLVWRGDAGQERLVAPAINIQLFSKRP